MELSDNQQKAIKELKNGNILLGGVGSGKSRTSLAYYYINIGQGKIQINDKGSFAPMKNQVDLYIITTAKKRDSFEWELEANLFLINTEYNKASFVVDSWNNIKKYENVQNAFFIFDEQRVIGYGAWSKAFIKISKNNRWILLTATPGDTWMDYIPVFIANGFYKNKTDFCRQHVVFDPYCKYQKVQRYIATAKLYRLRQEIMVYMDSEVVNEKKKEYVLCEYNKELYDIVFKKRWNPFKDEPIQNKGTVCLLLRQIVNTDESRLRNLLQLYLERKKVIVFYNFNSERDLICELCEKNRIIYSEWNGRKHEPIPNSDSWLYLVQYSSGAEGWNCIQTDTIIFYSLCYSYRMTEQASGRIDRRNTPFKKLHYYYLISNSSIDKAIKNALSKKKDFNETYFLDPR